MTIKQINKENPTVYVMATREFGSPVFIAPLKDLDIQVTDKVSEAEKWSYADTLSPHKLDYHKTITGYKGLTFEPLNN